MDNKEFDGKIALISGATRGIGKELALQLAERGAVVGISFKKNVELAEQLRQEIQGLGSDAFLCPADMEKQQDIQEMFDKITEEFGRLDIFVANAAATAFKPLADVKPHNIQRTFAISVEGFIYAVQRASALMKEGGRIVGVSGIDSIRHMENHGVLGAAKAAMESLIRSWACELADKGINVNGVCPGYVETDSAKTYVGEKWENTVPIWQQNTPKGRLAQASEIADVIRFFCSRDAGYVTGQTLVVDGGTSIVTPH